MLLRKTSRGPEARRDGFGESFRPTVAVPIVCSGLSCKLLKHSTLSYCSLAKALGCKLLKCPSYNDFDMFCTHNLVRISC